jgi:hypothetical protein
MKNCGFGQASKGITFIPYFVKNGQLLQKFNWKTYRHAEKLVILKDDIFSFGVRGDAVG